MTHLLLSLIRETLLLEEVYGAQATVYHGTKSNPESLIPMILKDKFKPGKGDGAMYGKGLYTVYDPEGTQTMSGGYGDWVIKFKVNLYGYIIFDADIAEKVYKSPLTPVQQAQELGYSDEVVARLKTIKQPRGLPDKITAALAYQAFSALHYDVKGIVFTGERDGRVAVIYDPSTVVPMSWKRILKDGELVNEPWTIVDRAQLLSPLHRPDVSAREGRPVQQSALRRSALGDFERGKYKYKPPKSFSSKGQAQEFLNRLEKLPANERVIKGSVSFWTTDIESLPANLNVEEDLILTNLRITSLPAGLKVGGNLDLSGTRISSLPADLNVDGDIRTPYGMTSLPAGFRVGGDLYVNDAKFTSLPPGLDVGMNLHLFRTPVTSLPADLQVGDRILGFNPEYWGSVPERLKAKLK